MQLEQVTYLDKEPAMELISKPIRYTNPESGAEESRYILGAEKLLYDLTAGSPYLILILCDKLVDYLNEIKSIYITASRIEKFIHEKVLCPSGCVTETTFEPQIQDRAKPELNSKNRELLLSIARAEVKGEANLAHLKCKIPEVERSELIDRLAERDVITISKNKYCRIKVRLLSEWLLYAYGRED
jgi:hypothetical protein